MKVVTVEGFRKVQFLRVLAVLVSTSLLLQSCQPWQNFWTCNKYDTTQLQACIREKFPPGSDYHELERYLEERDFSRTLIREEGDKTKFIFRWRSPILYIHYVGIIGWYDENLEIVEVSVP